MAKTIPTIAVVLAVLQSGPVGGKEISFAEYSDALGLPEPLKGIMAHAAACGDVDGDGDLDLYVGTFCDRPPEKYLGRAGPVSNMLLTREAGGYKDSGQQAVAMKARTSGAVFADLDHDGDLDLYVSNNSKRAGLRVPNKLFENVGGRFRDVSKGNGACVMMGGRSVSVLDFDGDGLLDLLVAEDKWTQGRTRLFRNSGGLSFEDVSAGVGLPEKLPGLGVITPDLNEDGRPDIFVSQANRLFLSGHKGQYREADSSVFQYEPLNREASPGGVAFGDVNRDGRLDIVIVDHSQPARQHLYINLGLYDSVPQFEDVTEEAGLDYLFPSWTPEGFHLKHTHVEICDIDNDGWPDILLAATYHKGGTPQPFVCRNTGELAPLAGGNTVPVPRFEVPPVAHVDAYFSSGPVADYDRDGKLDIFLASWFPQIPSKLFLNRSSGGHWLRVQVVGKTINRMGIGAKVRVYLAGKVGQAGALLGYQQIGTGFGFCSGQEAVAHFGLGEVTRCDVEVTLPHNRGVIRKVDVNADQVLLLQGGRDRSDHVPRRHSDRTERTQSFDYPERARDTLSSRAGLLKYAGRRLSS